MATQTQPRQQQQYGNKSDMERLMELADAPDMSDMNATAAINAAEVDVQVTTAKRFPRNPRQAKQTMIEYATLDRDTAGECFYLLPRGGKQLLGPSIRLAEIALSAWGNLRAETRIIEEGQHFITAEGVVWDLETNVAIKAQVRSRITKRDGRRYADDMVIVAGNAAASKALRNATFKAVPQIVWKPAFDAAQKLARGDIRSIAERRATAMDYCRHYGVTEATVLESFGIDHADSLTLDHLDTIRGRLTAIKDEEMTIEEAFSPKADAEDGDTSRTASVTSALKAKQNGGASKREAVPENVDPATGEVIDAPPGTTARGTDTSAIKDDEPRDWVMGGRKRGIANHPSKDDIEKLAGLLAKAGRSVEDTCRAMGLEHLAQIDNVDWAASMESLERDLQDKPDTDAP